MTTSPQGLKCCRAGFRYCMVLVSRAAADTNGAFDFSALLQRNPTCKNHDLAVVRGMDSEELSTGLRVRGQVLGRDVERSRSVGLLLRDIDTAQPGPVHANMRHDVAAFVRHGDVHRLADLLRFL